MIKEYREFNQKVEELERLNKYSVSYTLWENDDYHYATGLQDSKGNSYMQFKRYNHTLALVDIANRTICVLSDLKPSTTYEIVKFYREMCPTFTFLHI